MQPSESELQELKSNPSATRLDIDDLTFVIVKPGRLVYRNFANASMVQDREMYSAFETLCKACVKFPNPAALDEVFDNDPALVTQIGGEIVKLAKTEGTLAAKKL